MGGGTTSRATIPLPSPHAQFVDLRGLGCELLNGKERCFMEDLQGRELCPPHVTSATLENPPEGVRVARGWGERESLPLCKLPHVCHASVFRWGEGRRCSPAPPFPSPAAKSGLYGCPLQVTLLPRHLPGGERQGAWRLCSC